MRKRKIIPFLCAALMGISGIVGCGSVSEEGSAKETNLQTEQPESTKDIYSVQAKVTTVENTKNLRFLSTSLLCKCVDYGASKYKFYVWNDGKVTECEGNYVSENIIINHTKYSVSFSYCKVDSKIYIANTACACEEADIYVYPLGNRTDKVWMEAYILGECTYYYLDLNSMEVEKSVDFSDLGVSVSDFQISEDGKYALAITEEESYRTIFFDLEKNTHYDLAEQLKQEVRGARFYGNHSVGFFEEKTSGTCTYKTWNMEENVVNVVAEDVDNETVESLVSGYLFYSDSQKVSVVQYATGEQVAFSLEMSEYMDACVNETGNKILLLSYGDGNNDTEDIFIEKASILDLDEGTVTEISNLDTEVSYGIEINCKWTNDNTVTLATEKGLVSYSL